MQVIWTFLWTVIVALLPMLVPWASRSSSGSSPSFTGSFLNQVQEPPVRPLVELTVCPEGPPVCQFARIQQAIEAAPETPPVTDWQSPPEIPLIRIAPGLYKERLIILKNIWLKGADRELVTIRQEGKPQDPVTAFVAGSHYLAVVLQNLSIEGEVKVIGSISGGFFNNIFRPDSMGNGEVRLMGELALGFISNIFLDTSLFLYPVAPLYLPGVSDSVGVLFNQFVASKRKIEAAIHIQQSSQVAVNSNHIKGFSAGISLIGAEGIQIVANTLADNTVGIESCCGRSSDVEIRMNNLEHHSDAALQLSRASPGGMYLVTGNQITKNNKGIEWGSLAQIQITNNTVTHNEVGLELWPFVPPRDGTEALENLKECSNNRISENKENYVILGTSSELLRQRCEGS